MADVGCKHEIVFILDGRKRQTYKGDIFQKLKEMTAILKHHKPEGSLSEMHYQFGRELKNYVGEKHKPKTLRYIFASVF